MVSSRPLNNTEFNRCKLQYLLKIILFFNSIICFFQANFNEMMKRYKQLLTYIKSAVTRNYSEKSINSILDYISTSKQMELLQDFYETTLEALKEAKNERLWFKTNTKLGKLYFDRGDYSKLQKILKQLHLSCQVRFSPVLL